MQPRTKEQGASRARDTGNGARPRAGDRRSEFWDALAEGAAVAQPDGAADFKAARR